MFSVKRDRDGKVFTSDMSAEDYIYAIHFCTSYTQVKVQELGEDGILMSSDIICKPVGTQANWVDLFAIQDDDTGTFI
jgi:hypothetical protein